MSIMTNDGTLIMLGARYLRISSLSYLFIGLSQMYLCLMKNTGSAVMGMTVSTVGVIVHVVLNAALIYGIGSLGIPALGIFGAAISTVISRAIELTWSVVATRRGPDLAMCCIPMGRCRRISGNTACRCLAMNWCGDVVSPCTP